MPRLAALILGALVWMSVKLPVQANEVIVNRDTGRVLWRNSTSETLDVAAYTLRSTSGGFDATSWLSISENYDADSGAKLDADSTWFLLGGDALNLSEGTFSTTSIAAGGIIDLGTPWTPHNFEDVTFEYLDAGIDKVLPGSVQFISDLEGDYNGTGVVEQADLDLVLLNWGSPAMPVPERWINDLPLGQIDQAELDRVLLNWGTGSSAFLPSPVFDLAPSTLAIAEPSSLGLAMTWLAVVCFVGTRRRPLFIVQCDSGRGLLRAS